MVKVVNNESESFTNLVRNICWNFLGEPPILPEYEGRRLKFGCNRDKEIILRDISCNECRLYWNNFLKVKRTLNKKSFDYIEDNNRFGLGLEAIEHDAPHDIRLKNGLVLEISDSHQDLYPEEDVHGILFVSATQLAYYHFQSYINSDNDLKTKVKYRKRLKAFLKKEDFKDEWIVTPAHLYMFHEKYIVTMELNIILFLTGLTMLELEKEFQCNKRKNKLNQDIIMESESESDDEELPDLEFVG